MGELRYGKVKKVDGSFEDVLSQVTRELGKEGFGVLTEIDVQQTLKKKLDVDLPPYRILGACNPTLANKALAVEPDIGLLLPCNVVVRATGDGIVSVSIADAKAMFTLVENPQVALVAEEVDQRLRRVFDALR